MSASVNSAENDVVSVDSPLTTPAHARQVSDDEWEQVPKEDKERDAAVAAIPSTQVDEKKIDRSKAVQLDPGWVATTEDGQIAKLVLTEGDGESPPPLSRVYVQVKGKTADGKTFLDTKHEEIDFIVGHATMARGLEMVIVGMKPGETAAVRVGPGFGYSPSRRPAGVQPDDKLEFQVTLVRFEKEKNLHEMTDAEKFEFVNQRRTIGGALFEQKKYASAVRQYEKSMTVLDGMNNLSTEQEKERKQLQTLFLVNQAACKLKLGEHDEVISMARRALDLAPGHVKALWLRARAHHARSELAEARRDYEALLASNACDEKAKVATAKYLQALTKEQNALIEKQKKTFAGVFNNKNPKISLYEDKADPVVYQASPFSPLSILKFLASPVMWLKRFCKGPSKTGVAAAAAERKQKN